MKKRKSERHTESVVEHLLKLRGFSPDDFQFQGSYEPQIQKLLSSKGRGSPGVGKPELISRLNEDANDLLVVECKNDSAFHASKGVTAAEDLESANLDPVAFAEDGVIHYMRGLRKEFNVIGIAATGTDRESLRISHFRCFRGEPVTRIDAPAILKPKQYLSLLSEQERLPPSAEQIEDFAKGLHEFLRDEMELSEPEKPLLVSAILLALSVASFRRGYRAEVTGANLAGNLLATVERKLGNERLHPSKIELMMHNYGFIKNNTELHRSLKETVIKIESNVWGAVSSDANIDLLGDFYGEFLKYSGGDKKGLGIVLTPRHITGLFAKMAGLEKDSVLLDSCAGTGGFLIAGMAVMIKKARMDDDTIQEIKRSQLIGIEQNDRMFTLACANMLLRGDGKSNMFKGSCFDPIVRAKVNNRSIAREAKRIDADLQETREFLKNAANARQREITLQRIESLENRSQELSKITSDTEVKRDAIKRTPVAAILNPPYAKKASDKHEFAFVYEACEMLESGGTCVAIVPMSCAVEKTLINREWKRRLLQSHTLVAACSMPDQLFPMIGVVTVALVLSAHRPNSEEHETWFAYWKDDGFKLKKGKRVEVRPWKDTESRWLSTFRKRTESYKYAVLRHVTEDDEWCSEAYLEPSYTDISEADFAAWMREYVLNAFRLQQSAEFSDAIEDEEETT